MDKNDDEFIAIDELLKDILPQTKTNINEKIFNEQFIEYSSIDSTHLSEINETNNNKNMSQCKLYQIQGTENNAIIKFVGYSDPEKYNYRPCYILREFKFREHICQLVSYILSDVDIEHANNTHELKMVSILIKKSEKSQVTYAITYSFYTFIHIKQKKHLIEFISDNNIIELNGFFSIMLLKNDMNKSTNTRLAIYDKYKGKTQTIYDLISMLSDDKVIHIWE
jgi:hypothetical protein